MELRLVRIITLYEFSDGTWDGVDVRFDWGDPEARRVDVMQTDRDGVFDWATERLFQDPTSAPTEVLEEPRTEVQEP